MTLCPLGIDVPLAGLTLDTVFEGLFGSLPSGCKLYGIPLLIRICSATLSVLPTRPEGTTTIWCVKANLTSIYVPLGAKMVGFGACLVTSPVVLPSLTLNLKPAAVAFDSAS